MTVMELMFSSSISKKASNDRFVVHEFILMSLALRLLAVRTKS